MKKPLVGVVDYGRGNLRSVEKAIEAVGGDVRRVHVASDFEGIRGLVVPGVGAFGDCVRGLRERDLWEPVAAWLKADKPFFGICVGYQLLFGSSEEGGGVEGFGFFPGSVKRFPQGALKVPHMGWNDIEYSSEDPIFKDLESGATAYFLHSFYPELRDPAFGAAWCDYGVRFAAAARKGNVFGTQFHPEKSQAVGLTILRNFVESLTGN